ncbi:hypothetical protein POM88_005640 [Heracleum sosnowskyi]|uniref:Uncharacterized protein n=1 Tax=Heracleum sosnowskyi TaxID=360622 RepID=A0AAD8N4I0_9APIA|nr:hypothetical protein POM88_005640 [Heracleum sosnowskyi]
MDKIWIVRGARILYLGPHSITTVSHVYDIIGTSGFVHDVTHLPSPCPELSQLKIKRPNANVLSKFAIFNLKVGGHFVVSLPENLKNEVLEALILEHLKDTIDYDFERPERELVIGVQFQCLLHYDFKLSQHACLQREHYYFVGDYTRNLKPDSESDDC